MNVLEVREKLAAVLAPIASSDPDVLVSLVDSVEPPALMIGWDEPWMEADTACWGIGHIAITAIAARLCPGEGVATLESLIDYTLRRLAVEPENWNWRSVSGPRVLTIAKTNYLAARILVRVSLHR